MQRDVSPGFADMGDGDGEHDVLLRAEDEDVRENLWWELCDSVQEAYRLAYRMLSRMCLRSGMRRGLRGDIGRGFCVDMRRDRVARLAMGPPIAVVLWRLCARRWSKEGSARA